MTGRAGADHEALEHTWRKQALVISRGQALRHGMTPAMLRHRIRPGGPWQRLLPGVYLTVTGAPTQLQLEAAAALYAGPRSLLTSLAALRRHGLRVPDRRIITVLVPAGCARPGRDFVRITSTTRLPRLVCVDGATAYVMPERALADAARELASFREVRAVLAEAVQQRLCRIDLIGDELRRGPIRNSALLRRALAEVTGGIRSAAEGDLRDLIIRAGLPLPMFNASLYAGPERIAIADAWWAEASVAVEVDSREWHLSPEDWERTMRRHAALGKRGIVVLHFTPNQIRSEPGQVTGAIRAALAAGRPQETLGIRAVAAAG